MIVLAQVLTGGAPGGYDSLIKDVLNGAESAVEIKAPSVPLPAMLGLCMSDKDTSPRRSVEYCNAKL